MESSGNEGSSVCFMYIKGNTLGENYKETYKI